ncbi:MAG TPA: carboxypeptidase-like regulatory domain-containing protein [Ohtaekwangia sp.]|uniref:carboxypeptidase-like regulatory domain-containing protein n=1 Tax=Ohtaekwangia sp. TaxID=2066019 RepID=UPI002F92C9AD
MIIFSCSDDDNGIETNTLVGSVKLYDKYGEENLVYSDVTIKFGDVNASPVVVTPDANGKFKVDNLPKGDLLLTIDKPGYVGINTIKIEHTTSADTVSEIALVEEIPFSFDEYFWVDYADGWLSYQRSTNDKPDGDYMVGEYFCFSKSPEVSINTKEIAFGPGGYINAGYVNNVQNSSVTFSAGNFLSSGFAYGDKIYATNYAVSEMFSNVIREQQKKFNIVLYKMNNPSVINSFIFKEQ